MVVEVNIKNITLSNRKRPSCLQNLSFYLTEYCGNTSIHGLKFLGERGRSFVEKIWWLAFLTVSLYFCITLILQVYHKWENSPVIVTFATTQTPVWKIPFPAVSICPEIKSRKDVYNFTDEMLRKIHGDTIDEERTKKFEYMLLICPFVFMLYEDLNVTEITDENAVNFLTEVAPDFMENVISLKWLGSNLVDEVDMDKLFTPTLTSDGICYTFNMLNLNDIYTNETSHYKSFGWTDDNPSEWTLETGYREEAELNTFPRRTMLSGMQGGLELILITEAEDIDPLCKDSVAGYKVVLQHPAEVPKTYEHYFRVPLDQDVIAAVKPIMMTTSEDLKHYDPEDRQCHFIEERKLRFFKTYTQQNCLLECLTNFTYHVCGCAAFYMPRDDLTPICGPGMFWCIEEANTLFLASEVDLKLKSPPKERKKRKPTTASGDKAIEECDCLPSCTSLEFDTETSQSDWNWKAVLPLLNLTTELNKVHFSKLKIFFKDMQFITSERNQLYGQTDFWANCGGLLGLFTGFSFISLVEILYFATLRFICNVRKFGLRYWSGAQELIEKAE